MDVGTRVRECVNVRSMWVLYAVGEVAEWVSAGRDGGRRIVNLYCGFTDFIQKSNLSGRQGNVFHAHLVWVLAAGVGGGAV